MRDVHKFHFSDLVGTHVLQSVHVGETLPSLQLAHAELYGRRVWHRYYLPSAQNYGDYHQVEVPNLLHQFLTLITSEGMFVFPINGNSYSGAYAYGLWVSDWVPDFQVDAPGQVVELRVAPTHELHYLRMYAVDEATGLVCLEFGTSSRADDPNQRHAHQDVFRYEGGAGWDSPYLHAPPEVSGVEIRREYGFTPKSVGSGTRGSRKGMF